VLATLLCGADSNRGAGVNRRTVRVLVVDDSAPWYEFVFSIFQGNSKFRVIGQASDGLQGVQKALELKPDLIA
jgi:chemotaxis response regulator CheB